MSILEATLSLNLSSDFYFPNIKPDIISKEIEVSDKINFLLCESCFWCASYFNNYRMVVLNVLYVGTKTSSLCRFRMKLIHLVMIQNVKLL